MQHREQGGRSNEFLKTLPKGWGISDLCQLALLGGNLGTIHCTSGTQDMSGASKPHPSFLGKRCPSCRDSKASVTQHKERRSSDGRGLDQGRR